MGMIRYFRGCAKVKVTGASVETLLNRLSDKKIQFWQLERLDELHYTFSVYLRDYPKLEKLAIDSFCHIELLKRSGFYCHIRLLRKRPLLWLGMLAAIVMSFCFQSYVLIIEVEGAQNLHPQQVVRALQELDIEIGSFAGRIEQQMTKHRMLNRLPELSWIGVNRSGCKLHVLVTERSEAKSNRPPYPCANIIASRDAVLQEVIVSEGMRLCKAGDTVKEGQILVSGFEDYGLILKGVCAEAEIYGQTWYASTVLTPVKTYEKHYTGHIWRQYTLLVGRKRINLCGNSGILGMTCDKMVEVRELRIPNYKFPLSLEIATYREYELREKKISPQEAEKTLLRAWEALLCSEMIAGRIIDTQSSCIRTNEMYALQVESTCHEMIARYAPLEAVFEGEGNE